MSRQHVHSISCNMYVCNIMCVCFLIWSTHSWNHLPIYSPLIGCCARALLRKLVLCKQKHHVTDILFLKLFAHAQGACKAVHMQCHLCFVCEWMWAWLSYNFVLLLIKISMLWIVFLSLLQVTWIQEFESPKYNQKNIKSRNWIYVCHQRFVSRLSWAFVIFRFYISSLFAQFSASTFNLFIIYFLPISFNTGFASKYTVGFPSYRFWMHAFIMTVHVLYSAIWLCGVSWIECNFVYLFSGRDWTSGRTTKTNSDTRIPTADSQTG